MTISHVDATGSNLEAGDRVAFMDFTNHVIRTGEIEYLTPKQVRVVLDEPDLRWEKAWRNTEPRWTVKVAK